MQTRKVSRLRLLAEILFFVAFAFGTRILLSGVLWRYAGPVSLVATLGLATIYLRRHDETWREIGLRPLPGARAKLRLIPRVLLTFAAFLAAVAVVVVGPPALGVEFMTETPVGVVERWGDVEGNLPLFLLWLGIAWTAAAFGEEMFFRGFLITRLQRRPLADDRGPRDRRHADLRRILQGHGQLTAEPWGSPVSVDPPAEAILQCHSPLIDPRRRSSRASPNPHRPAALHSAARLPASTDHTASGALSVRA